MAEERNTRNLVSEMQDDTFQCWYSIVGALLQMIKIFNLQNLRHSLLFDMVIADYNTIRQYCTISLQLLNILIAP